jgi:SAM-dependent methyltransferase
MMSPFDALAADYGALWSETPRGREQRDIVWREIDGLFRPGDRILDLGCGTGDDALHLAKRGVEVFGIDNSPRMVEMARSRGVDAAVLGIEDLPNLKEIFSGAISNFGALNCVSDLEPVAQELSKRIRANGYLAICLMGRFCWSESLRGEFRRWPGRTEWRGISVYYPGVGQVVRAFGRYFELVRDLSIDGGDHHLYTFRRRLKEESRP